MTKILAIIPARGGSKGIPKKNLRQLAGKPLIAYTIEAAKKSKYLDAIYVSTEDADIEKISKALGAKIIKRPLALASDDSPTQDCVKHAFKYLRKEGQDFEFIVLLQPTSPLRSIETIDKAIEIFIEKSKNYDSLISLKKAILKKGTILDNKYIPENRKETRRQALKAEYIECGTIFIYKANLIDSEIILGSEIFPFIVEKEEETIDIDNIEDFEIAEAIIRYRRERNEQ